MRPPICERSSIDIKRLTPIQHNRLIPYWCKQSVGPVCKNGGLLHQQSGVLGIKEQLWVMCCTTLLIIVPLLHKPPYLLATCKAAWTSRASRSADGDPPPVCVDA